MSSNTTWVTSGEARTAAKSGATTTGAASGSWGSQFDQRPLLQAWWGTSLQLLTCGVTGSPVRWSCLNWSLKLSHGSRHPERTGLCIKETACFRTNGFWTRFLDQTQHLFFQSTSLQKFSTHWFPRLERPRSFLSPKQKVFSSAVALNGSASPPDEARVAGVKLPCFSLA